ncbi:Nif3-like dinuclear metal center hexameric protein [Levilactobacillus bambusae]|uniref:GTP cyclohydrolase 1 type 2 homolog n=1 Tax=Levilactobacillus bambusae TaxID=2024736 RepID=A0A2V1N0P1_9LACO|nr:Nif3-like dinuclear metal center hexameric protein [Levilactobacillus bambusae]PWG00784.1 Nif3-like dinuclear metal center hexameric protein [Levilactobacillus bambusae]
MKASQLVQRFEQFAPRQIAEKNDPVGLQIGDLAAEIHKVMVTLDVRPEVVDEAIAQGADFIFSHHPVMFRPAKNLDLSDPQNAMYAKLIQHRITVYSAHTNLDSADGGMNDWLAEALDLHETVGLWDGVVEPEYLLCVHVPTIYADAIRLALVKAGTGETSSYTGGSYTSHGRSFFTLNEGANPAMGEVGEQNEVDEVAIEVRVSESQVTNVVDIINQVHPFDTPAYTLTPLARAGHQYSMGRVGNLASPTTVREFAERCKKIFQVNGLRLISHHPDQIVNRVAVLGGDGGKFYRLAQQKGADVYVTGDVYYHTGHDMLAAGMNAIDPGHHIEAICIPKLVTLFTRWSAQYDWNLEVSASSLNTDPFTFL